MSDFKFRFGTYGSNNPLYSIVREEKPIEDHVTSFSKAVDSYSTTKPEHVTTVSGSLDNILVNKSESFVFEKSSFKFKEPMTITCTSGFNPTTESYSHVKVSFDYEVHVKDWKSAKVSVGTIYLTAYFENKEDKKEQEIKTSANWYAYLSELQGTNLPSGKGTLLLDFDNTSEFLLNNTLKRIELDYLSGTLDEITISNFNVNGVSGGDVDSVPRIIKVLDDDGNKVFAYLCPWELKHVESISVTISGQTSTMGIPNKPASRTQIFDTGGAIRTIKISGKRYDYEENVSNWDFIYNQYNVAEDSEYKGKKYTYIGISWLLSTIQVLLKGYTFNVRSSGFTDFRYPYTTNPTLSDCIMVDSVSQLPSGAIFEGLFGYAKDVKKIYQNRNGTWWTYIPIEDTGYNVALTGFNSTFSESQPGLLDYSLTLTERFKNGNSLYNPYNPIF